MHTYFRYFATDKKLISFLIILTMALVSFIAFTLVQAQSNTTPQGYQLVWSDEFNDSTVDTSKWSITHQTRSTESHHQGRYLTRNVSESGGNLRITTERHCVASGELPSDTNRSTAPCPAGKTTAYSSGQVKSGYNWKAGKVEIRAKLPQTTQSGLWSGYWLRQQGTWCTQDYGEIDILEWYSDAKSTNASTATTHVTCANDKLTSRQHLQRVNGSLADSWHTWGVEWDKTGVTYYLDGKVVPSISSHRPDDDNQSKDTYTDFTGVSKAVFESVMDRAWQLRINTQVYGETDQWHEAPNNSTSFAPQTFLVDYVRIYAPGSGTTAPTPAPTPAPTSPTPTAEKTTESATSGTTEVQKTSTTKESSSTDTTSKPDDTATTESTPHQSSDKQTSAPIAPRDNASPSPSTETKVDTETPRTLPKTGPVFWSIVGGLPLALITATGIIWHRSRVR